jgi:hypothetical protein
MRRGTSALELCIAMALLSLFVGMVYSLLSSATREVDGQSAIASLDLEAQELLDRVCRNVHIGHAPADWDGPDRVHSIRVVRKDENGRIVYDISATVTRGAHSRTRRTTVAAR